MIVMSTYSDAMAKERLNFWIEQDHAAGLKAIRVRDGVPVAEQIRRGIQLYLESKGETQPKRKGAKKR